MKLNVFTPLPPARTDIANHSTYILPHLAARAEIIAWCAQDDVTDAPWARTPGLEVRRYGPGPPPWAALTAADANIFNFGNNLPFHHPIHLVARQMPGIVVLHDTALQHFFAGIAQHPEGAAEYAGLMRRHHGAAGQAAAAQLIRGEVTPGALSDDYPLSLGVAARALAIVVHNAAEVARLQAGTRTPVHMLPLALDAARVSPPDRAGRPPPWRLIVFGHLGANRRVDTVLAALARTPGPFRLDIYGQAEDPEAIRSQIAKLGLDARVTLHGHVPGPVLDQALNDADLAINLRFPTMGEASGSQLRVFAHGLPSVVSRIGWYATLPAEAVHFVAPDDDGTELSAILQAFSTDPDRARAAGQRGREIVLRTHAPEAYAEALLRIAADAAEQHRRRATTDLVDRSAQEAVTLGGQDMVAAFGRGAAREIACLFGQPQ